MAINFPSSPSNNQLFVTEGKAMRYNATKNRWKAVSTLSSSQITDLEARTVGVSAMSISGNTLVIQKDDSSYANVSLASFAGNKLTTYANASILPLSDLVSGTQVYVEDTDSLYITDGSGWYKIATVNLSPSLTLGVSSISLGSGGSVDVNYTVNEPEDTPYTVSASSTSNATITVHQANNTITFDTPVAATTETITITATDGVNSVGDTLTMTITIGPDWSTTSLAQTLQHPTGKASARFGGAVSFDGTTLVVGSRSEDSTRGYVRIYTLSGGSWSLQQEIVGPRNTNDAFGGQVSVDGDTVAISAPGYDASGTTNTGGVYIFTRSGSTWSQQALLVPSDAGSYEEFGNEDLRLRGDELAVSCPYDGGDNVLRGAVYFFKRSGTTWTQSQKIVSQSAYNNERFGNRVDFQGEVLALHGFDPQDQNTTYPGGYVGIYTRSGTGNWAFANNIQGSDTTTSEQFGTSISIGENEDYLAVGAWKQGTSNGAVYVFTGSGGAWTQQAKLLASDTSSNYYFGSDVEFGDANAEVLAVGSWQANGSNNTINDAGAAYVFTRSGNTWTEEIRLESANAQTEGYFGNRLSTSNNILAITASNEGYGANTRSGAVYIFEA